MLPTLHGRLQTRVFLIAVIGGLWALVIAPLLPADATTADNLRTMYALLAIVLVLGLAWEVLYHVLQQFRWEKDWPTMFALLVGVPEGLVAYAVARTGLLPWAEAVTPTAFAVGFGTTWLVTWLFVSGPMRVLSVHWRFRGGRLV